MLRVQNLETYYGPIMAIRGVSLEVAKGSVVAVLGANGAGKTTLLKTISGLLDPKKGSIEFEGRPVAARNPYEMVRLGISQVPEGREVFPFLSVRENLELGAFARKDRSVLEADYAKIYAYFPRLKERERSPAGLLSGGEQQMLAIGRALMARPRLMLLDEPSLGLSPLLVEEIFAIVKRINREEHISILLVEQNAALALRTADYGYVMENGRVVMEDSAERLLQKDDIKEFYLGAQQAGVRGERRWKRRKTWR